MTKIKICGLKREEDIEMAGCLKPDYCGFIVNYPKSRRSISPGRLKELTALLDRSAVKAVGVFVDEEPELIAELLNDGVIDIAQLHGKEDEDYIAAVQGMTDGPVIKAFTVRSREDIKKALQSSAEYILLDQGKGGGQAFDWKLLEEDTGLKGRKWFLAGGIDEGNVRAAIEAYHPYAVDLSSAVETDGYKDALKVKRIIDIVRNER